MTVGYLVSEPPSNTTLVLLLAVVSFMDNAVVTSAAFAFVAKAVVTSAAFAFKFNAVFTAAASAFAAKPGTVGKLAVPAKSPAS